jgi:hypothetical protein
VDRHSDGQLQSDLDLGVIESHETLKYPIFMPYAECINVRVGDIRT